MFWELNFWFFMMARSSILPVKLELSMGQLRIQLVLEEASIYDSEGGAASSEGVRFINLLSVVLRRANGLRSSLARSEKKVRDIIMHCDVFLICGLR